MFAVAVIAIVSGCVSHRPLDDLPLAGFTRAVEQGGAFRHLVLFRPGKGTRLHVYIEGDGRPWLSPDRVALDPSGSRLWMLELALLDPAPVLYVGRPCYFVDDDPACTPQWWTFRRYAPAVVDSLAAVIRRWSHGYDTLALFGHSGGGALVMLLAPALVPDTRGTNKVAVEKPAFTAGESAGTGVSMSHGTSATPRSAAVVDTVVTIAGNLDTAAWTEAHAYTPLYGSLNPAEQPPLPTAVRQYHAVGDQDNNVTAAMIEPVIRAQPDAELEVVPGYDHTCCWREYWPGLLRAVDAATPPMGRSNAARPNAARPNAARPNASRPVTNAATMPAAAPR